MVLSQATRAMLTMIPSSPAAAAPQVLTNDPDYTWQLRHLNGYAGVRSLDPDEPGVAIDTAIGSVPSVVGHGWNLFGASCNLVRA